MNISQWHTFPEKYKDKIYLCEVLLKNGFDVWKWKNSNRITVQGDKSALAFMVMIEQPIPDFYFSFVESKYPIPYEVPNLSVQLNMKNYIKEFEE